MRTHADRDFNQNIVGLVPASGRIESQQGTESRRSLRHCRRLLFDKLDVRAFKNGNVSELCRGIVAPVLQDEHSRSYHFNNQTPRRNRARDSPSAQLAIEGPDADVNAGLFHCWRQPGQQGGLEPRSRIELQRPGTLLRRQKGDRDSRSAALLVAKARPERRGDDLLDGGRIRLQDADTASVGGTLRNPLLKLLRNKPRGWVCGTAHHNPFKNGLRSASISSPTGTGSRLFASVNDIVPSRPTST